MQLLFYSAARLRINQRAEDTKLEFLDGSRLIKRANMNQIFHVIKAMLLVGFISASLAGCGYNTLQTQDEQISASWAEVLNQFQRRADLIPNLVATVKGYAEHESKVLQEVTKARSNVSGIRVDQDMLNDPKAFQRFQAAQNEIKGALSRLIAVSENYPQLKADGSFQNLQAQLEGTENRITVARGRFIKAVQEYNTTVRSFPSNLTAKVFGYQLKASFAVEDEKALSKPPPVSFN